MARARIHGRIADALTLPAPTAPLLAGAGVVAVPVADLRRRPGQASELVSQGLFGETYRVLGRSRDGRWLHARGDEDGYAGWMRSWSLALGARPAVAAWRARANLRVDRPWIELGAGLGALPFGARVALVRGGAFGPLGPLGPAQTGLALLPSTPTRSAPARLGRALVATARRFEGVSYHWGGRTFAGTDCSGLVQLAARPHGLFLPRDARDQCRKAGGTRGLRRFESALSPAAKAVGILPGDLWFFGPRAGGVTHVAISTGGLELVHAYGRVGPGSLDPGSGEFLPELFRSVLGWAPLRRLLPRSTRPAHP
ncbi:MAG: NlpC/P60 family protein [Candidatus Eisenbacteria bacterium]